MKVRNFLFSFLFISISLTLVECTFGQAKNRNQLQVENREVSSFHSIEISGLANVYLSNKGNPNTIKVEVSGVPIAELITKVEDEVLKVTSDKKLRGENIKVYVSTNSLKSIKVSDAAELHATGPIQGDVLEIKVNKNASAWLEVNSNLLKVEMQDAANLTVMGTTKQQSITSFSKTGTFDNSELKLTAN